MPITAKLSLKFYERLGDEIAGEIVDWFNSVDAEYQDQLRETNDLNWERFKAELRAQGAELRGEMVAMGADLRSELIKWMFIFWTGTLIPLAGLIIALHRH